MTRVTAIDLHKAIINWQNTVGCELNGQLEAYLTISLGWVYDVASDSIQVTDETAERIRKLLGENHPTMIKVWLARNK